MFARAFLWVFSKQQQYDYGADYDYCDDYTDYSWYQVHVSYGLWRGRWCVGRLWCLTHC